MSKIKRKKTLEEKKQFDKYNAIVQKFLDKLQWKNNSIKRKLSSHFEIQKKNSASSLILNLSTSNLKPNKIMKEEMNSNEKKHKKLEGEKKISNFTSILSFNYLQGEILNPLLGCQTMLELYRISESREVI